MVPGVTVAAPSPLKHKALQLFANTPNLSVYGRVAGGCGVHVTAYPSIRSFGTETVRCSVITTEPALACRQSLPTVSVGCKSHYNRQVTS